MICDVFGLESNCTLQKLEGRVYLQDSSTKDYLANLSLVSGGITNIDDIKNVNMRLDITDICLYFDPRTTNLGGRKTFRNKETCADVT